MHNLSLIQALSLWSELEQAYFNRNGYGSDTAELYLYRFMPHHPGIDGFDKGGIFGEIAREAYADACVTLHALLAHFAETRSARIRVNGRPLGPWIKKAGFTHRVHVKVTPKATPRAKKAERG